MQPRPDFGNCGISTSLPDRTSDTAARSALILGRNNGVGLAQDAQLLSAALAENGIISKIPGLRSLRDLLSKTYRSEIAFHLERVAPWWKYNARKHILIPNQERFPERLIKRLKQVDHVFCKSHHATEIFSRHHPSVHFIGFTSQDRSLDAVRPNYDRFFHLAGKSTLKNTEVLLELWAQHPEWPRLTLVQHPDNAPSQVPENVELISRYLADEELRTLQNQCGIHLCPSLSEGWGHYIVEAMSCRAVTLVTDAPPMNELVDPSRGVTVAYHRREPRHLGENFYVDPTLLELAIEQLISQSPSEKAALGEAARNWFLANQQTFPGKIGRLIETLKI